MAVETTADNVWLWMILKGTRVTVEYWPETAEFSDELLVNANPARLRVADDHVYLTVDNGEATYLVTERNPTRMTRRAGRLYGRIDS